MGHIEKGKTEKSKTLNHLFLDFSMVVLSILKSIIQGLPSVSGRHPTTLLRCHQRNVPRAQTRARLLEETTRGLRYPRRDQKQLNLPLSLLLPGVVVPQQRLPLLPPLLCSLLPPPQEAVSRRTPKKRKLPSVT